MCNLWLLNLPSHKNFIRLCSIYTYDHAVVFKLMQIFYYLYIKTQLSIIKLVNHLAKKQIF